MDIILVTPQLAARWSGNRVTSDRWRAILRALGHQVRVTTEWDGAPADMMIALHAWRSRESIARFRREHPDRPLIVALVGTDAYEYMDTDPEPTTRSLELADRLVGLHEHIAARLPVNVRAKLTIIRQSAEPPPATPPPSSSGAAALHTRTGDVETFDVAVIGHLRAVKDPLRTALAARGLPADSRVRVVHLGAALSPDWEAAARREMAENPRYTWLGEVSHDEARRTLARSDAIVLSSVSEGGANVVSEAAVMGVAVLSSRIDAVVALLGADYPGYFEVGDTAALTVLLRRIETDVAFARQLRARLAAIAPGFSPAAEQESWRKLIDGLGSRPGHT